MLSKNLMDSKWQPTLVEFIRFSLQKVILSFHIFFSCYLKDAGWSDHHHSLHGFAYVRCAFLFGLVWLLMTVVGVFLWCWRLFVDLEDSIDFRGWLWECISIWHWHWCSFEEFDHFSIHFQLFEATIPVNYKCLMLSMEDRLGF